MNVASRGLYGALAGAAGTAVLDAITYVDMGVRGRPPSELPDKTARKLAEMAGLDEFAKPADDLNDRTKNQRSGLAALLGYADGFSAGAIFGIVRPYVRGVPWFWAGIGLAGLTMLMSEGLATKLGQTDPSTWPISSWIEDIVPRCAYGWTTAIVFDRCLGD